MGKKLKVLISASLLCITLSGQSFHNSGLDYFNPYVINPALLKTDKNFQIDVSGRLMWYIFDNSPYILNGNFIFNIENIKSTFLVGSQYNNFGTSQTLSSLFSYAFHHQFNQNISIDAGTGVNFYQLYYDKGYAYYYNISQGEIPPNIDLYSKFGANFSIYNFSLSYSTTISLLEQVIPSGVNELYAEPDDLIDKFSLQQIETNFMISYYSPDIHKFVLKPMIRINRQLHSPNYSNTNVYVGLFTEYNNLFEMGMVYGNTASISASVKLIKFAWLIINLDCYNKLKPGSVSAQIRLKF
ncbi:type IX secretion system membrane protein PorP/SprF [Saccharicrinis sp. FJH2]|uniref:type IX secretion system membrane protein PorP/SprF n=1 Tax=Saccharicrinis sp. FJH65 TaxID=3344659 RepID=UPI0035F41F8E